MNLFKNLINSDPQIFKSKNNFKEYKKEEKNDTINKKGNQEVARC